jgi:hypothetical protein
MTQFHGLPIRPQLDPPRLSAEKPNYFLIGRFARRVYPRR